MIQEFGAKIKKKPALRAGFSRFFVAVGLSTLRPFDRLRGL
jgi:hypothetical protein